jgi:hypothetical protein
MTITGDDIDPNFPIPAGKIDISWLEPVSNTVNLPVAADDGDVVVTVDTGVIYIRNSGSWSTATQGTYDSLNFDSDFSGKTTDDLGEGSTNKYFS